MALARELRSLRAELDRAETAAASVLAELPEPNRPSARNLLHYVALRRRDIRSLQDRLAAHGLSSLGRAESHVGWAVDAVADVLEALVSPAGAAPRAPVSPAGFHEGRERLARRTEALLGSRPAARDVRIMVTMPKEAAVDYALIRDLLSHGMDAIRINCAHDTSDDWSAMLDKLRRAEREVGRHCRVLMDLGGPKLRTGPIAEGPRVVRWRPQRDALGHVTAPARIWLTPAESPAAPPLDADAVLPVPADWLATLKPKDTIKLNDVRGAARTMKIVGEAGPGRWAVATRSAWVTPGTPLVNAKGRGEGLVGPLPSIEESLTLRPGDTLLLTRDLNPGRPALEDSLGRMLTPATIGCTLPEVFKQVSPGERIWFDDGKIGGVIRSVGADQLHVEVTVAREKGEKLRSDKGINLPDSALRLPALTAKDLQDLPFVAANADLVGLSFVQRDGDVRELGERLAALGAAETGVVLKIETRRAFEALPELLLSALRLPKAGVMIARGDLLVECGYERLAEIQEEILWLCEAAHLPVIWATQVLEGLAQKGLPSRAEITDAAMGERAECVMLNKGPHILETIRVLDSILRRMQAHQSKKSPRLRRLHF